MPYKTQNIKRHLERIHVESFMCNTLAYIHKKPSLAVQWSYLLHDLQFLRNCERSISLGAHLLNFDSWCKLSQSELTSGTIDLEDTLKSKSVRSGILKFKSGTTYQISDNSAHNVGTSQGQTTGLHNLGRPILGNMARGNHNLCLVRVGDQVHGTTHALEDLAWDHVVGEIAVCAYLEGLNAC